MVQEEIGDVSGAVEVSHEGRELSNLYHPDT